MFSSPDAEVCCRPDDRASKKKDTEATSKDPAAVNKPVRVGLRAVYVFDVAQTEGAGSSAPSFTRCCIRQNAALPPPRPSGKTEAEAIAFALSQTIGLDAGRASADYIHLYHGNAGSSLTSRSLELRDTTKPQNDRSMTRNGEGGRFAYFSQIFTFPDIASAPAG